MNDQKECVESKSEANDDEQVDRLNLSELQDNKIWYTVHPSLEMKYVASKTRITCRFRHPKNLGCEFLTALNKIDQLREISSSMWVVYIPLDSRMAHTKINVLYLCTRAFH